MSDVPDQWSGVGLLLVDVQNDFIHGSLAVPDAKSILPTVKRLIDEYPFQVVFCSQDYHPPTHISFASRHATDAFQTKKLDHPIAAKARAGETIDQMMWPDHCIQQTSGCQFHRDVLESLEAREARGEKVLVVQKGENVNVDGYSAFSSNHYLGFTSLPRMLFSQSPPIHTLVVVGLATDYCVLSSAVDAAKFQLRTIVIQDGIRGVDKGTTAKAEEEMADWGIRLIRSDAALADALAQGKPDWAS